LPISSRVRVQLQVTLFPRTPGPGTPRLHRISHWMLHRLESVNA